MLQEIDDDLVWMGDESCCFIDEKLTCNMKIYEIFPSKTIRYTIVSFKF
jgi:hypothetical protein